VLFVGRALLAERQTVDDVFIFLRYARRLAQNGQYAFNASGFGARVEGTSSVVWTLVLSVAWRLGLRGVGAAKALSLVAGALVLPLSALAVRRAAPQARMALAVPALALTLDADLATWAASGMDTALWTLACVGCVALVASRRERAAAAASGALAWVRPEGPLFAAAAVLAMSKDRRSAIRLALVAAAPVVVLTLARLAYFHDVVPNTFWAKMHVPAEGRDYDGPGYLASALERRPLLLVVVPLAALCARLLGARVPGASPAVRVAWSMLGASVVFALTAGGDWMPNRRLLVVGLPLAAVAVGITLGQFAGARLSGSALRPFAFAAAAALPLEAGLTTGRAVDQRWRRVEWVDERLAGFRLAKRPFVDPYLLDWMPTRLMNDLSRYVAPGDVVAHVDVGELPYVMADVSFLDGFGLVDRNAGRLAFWPRDTSLRDAAREEFFRLRPAAAIVVFDEVAGRPFSAAQDAVAEDARFVQEYRELARVRTWGDHPCVTYVRRDLRDAGVEAGAARVRRWLASVRDVKPAF
jgi:hypothetical protein